MSRVSDIIDQFYAEYPGQKFDWRFRAGRMAEEIDKLRCELTKAETPAAQPRRIRMDSIEIRIVSNGYMVQQARMDSRELVCLADVHVFESFDSLVAWLGDNFRPQPQPAKEK